MTRYISLELAIELHDRQLEQFGGAPGIRDKGVLEAALARPLHGYYSDLVEEAAALWESMAQNHPFIDGNKRAAFAVMHVFLLLNGLKLTASSDDTYAFIIGLYEAKAFRYDALLAWLKANTSS
ncbi:type II toxin-antitoxin system death-on-curing family toxin [Chelatococcus asaccharovorans]|nr:type II toxin-antitoxin system death-on-curing family toxin [Chelatococcus asaccharovorans]CAH1669092.1 Death-on-curing protein [Chelatococcus asaccharovorans]CAH1679464.1 Death-on-curing protein [Chelatococcus asaccharovorans]